MRKLKFFLDDIRWFLPLSETKIEKKLAIVFKKIEQTVFTGPELGYFENIRAKLNITDNVKFNHVRAC